MDITKYNDCPTHGQACFPTTVQMDAVHDVVENIIAAGAFKDVTIGEQDEHQVKVVISLLGIISLAWTGIYHIAMEMYKVEVMAALAKQTGPGGYFVPGKKETVH